MSPMHEDNPNTRNGARLRSPSLIMAPDENENESHFHNQESMGRVCLPEVEISGIPSK